MAAWGGDDDAGNIRRFWGVTLKEGILGLLSRVRGLGNALQREGEGRERGKRGERGERGRGWDHREKGPGDMPLGYVGLCSWDFVEWDRPYLSCTRPWFQFPSMNTHTHRG